MDYNFRQTYNNRFTLEWFDRYQNELHQFYQHPIQFKLAETPVFIPSDLKSKIESATNSIIDQLFFSDYLAQADGSIPDGFFVPGDELRPPFIQLDFAITKDSKGIYNPQLIEMQGFPALFFFQMAAYSVLQKMGALPNSTTSYFGDWAPDKVLDSLREIILGAHHPKEVVLLEWEPRRQPTAYDFAGANHYLGIPIIDIKEVIKKENHLYYKTKKGETVRIKRIYNRVILAELKGANKTALNFNMTERVDVEWAGHPNWFLKISKYALPFLQHDSVPKAIFLKDQTGYEALDDYVLKPIHTFSGNGVNLQPTEEVIRQLPHPNRYILQKRIQYAPVIPSPDGRSAKMEFRVLLLWPENKSRPELVTNLVRLSHSDIMGTTHQKTQFWSGGGIGFWEKY